SHDAGGRSGKSSRIAGFRSVLPTLLPCGRVLASRHANVLAPQRCSPAPQPLRSLPVWAGTRAAPRMRDVWLDIHQRWNRRIGWLDAHVPRIGAGASGAILGICGALVVTRCKLPRLLSERQHALFGRPLVLTVAINACFRVGCSGNRQLGTHIRLICWRRGAMVVTEEPRIWG